MEVKDNSHLAHLSADVSLTCNLLMTTSVSRSHVNKWHDVFAVWRLLMVEPGWRQDPRRETALPLQADTAPDRSMARANDAAIRESSNGLPQSSQHADA